MAGEKWICVFMLLGLLLLSFEAQESAAAQPNPDDIRNAAETNCLLPEYSCPGKHDVVVMLDRSKKVNQETYTGYMELIKRLLRLFYISEDGNHFGLVVYNNNAQISMKLNENNDVEFIENYLMTSLPGRQGGRNVKRALQKTRQELLTPVMGDRPNVTNVCLVLTTAFDVRTNREFPKMKAVCDRFVVLRSGDHTDLQKVREKACPAAFIIDTKETKKLRCPLPYLEFGDWCFHVIFRQMNFDQALQGCQNLNGSLVKIDSALKLEKLIHYYDSLRLTFTERFLYIGLRDETGDNMDYRWISDNTLAHYTNWKTGQPDQASQPCTVMAAINFTGNPKGSWTDTQCVAYSGAVCETDQKLWGSTTFG